MDVQQRASTSSGGFPVEHVVFYTGPDRAPAFRRTPSLDEAVRFVESLRNGEGIDDSKVFSLTEIPLRFQTYYRVEVPADSAQGGAAAPPAPPAPSAPTAATEQVAPPPPAFPAPEPFTAPDVPPAPVVEVVSPPAAAEPVFEPIAGSAGEAAAEGGSVDVASDSDAGDGAANGKPNRGLGFFAR